jgi:hypothetical protein
VPTFKNKSEVNDLLVKSRHYEVLRPKIDWKLCWKDLETKNEAEMLTFYRELLLHLGTKTEGRVQEIFQNANTSLRLPRHLKELVTQIDAIEWYEAREEGALADLYEGLLQKNAEEIPTTSSYSAALPA